MESRIWSTSGEKRASIFMLRDQEVHELKVNGSMLTLNRKYKAIIEALEQGHHPAEVGADSVLSVAIAKIRKAEIAPGNSFLTLHGEEGYPDLSFVPDENNADEIFRAIMNQSGRVFEAKQEEIGVGEALIPPGIVGVVGGLIWAATYYTAGQIAAGEEVEAKGIRRHFLKNLLIAVAEFLGTGGTIAVGVVLLILILGWGTRRIMHRPERTVWLPGNA